MAGIGDMIWQLAGHQDPKLAMLQAMMGGGDAPQPGVATPGAPGTGGAPEGPASTPQPQAYTSPPDLVSLYSDLVKKDQFSSSVGNGLGLIMAGFAAPEDKQSIIDGLAGGSGSDTVAGGGGSDPMTFISNIMKMQADRATQIHAAANRAALPDIAKTYGLDLKTATYLFDAGSLDSVIAELKRPNKQLTEDANGQHRIVDLTSGEVSDPIGPVKARETQIITDGNTGEQFAVYKDNGKRVGNESIVKGQRKTEYVDNPAGKGGKVLIYSDDRTPVAGGAPITSIAAPPRPTEYIKNSDGSQQLVYSDDKTPANVPGSVSTIAAPKRATEYIDNPDGKGGKVLVYSDDKSLVTNPSAVQTIKAPPKEVQFIDDGQGGKKAMYKDGTPIPEKDIPGLGAEAKTQLYNASKNNWIKMGKSADSFPDEETWLTLHEANSSTRMSVDVGGNELPKPPEGFAWKHGADGKVPYDENGAPIAVPIGGTKQAQEAADAGKIDATKDLNAAVGGTIVGQEVNRALDNIMANKDNWISTTGMGSLFSFIPGSPQKALDQNLTTIRSNVTKDALQAMRAANPTGAAFGNVSDFEDKLMQATVGSLDPSGKPADIIYNLRRVQALYGAIITGHIKDEAEAQRILKSVPYPTPEELDAPYTPQTDPTAPNDKNSGKSIEDPTLEDYVKKHSKAPPNG